MIRVLASAKKEPKPGRCQGYQHPRLGCLDEENNSQGPTLRHARLIHIYIYTHIYIYMYVYIYRYRDAA